MAGRKPLDINLAEVERLAGLGLSEVAICVSLGIGRETLRRRKRNNEDFEAALQKGKAAAHQQVANMLFGKCLEGDLGAIIWYEKTRCGMSDRVAADVSGTVQIEYVNDWRQHPT